MHVGGDGAGMADTSFLKAKSLHENNYEDVLANGRTNLCDE